MFLFKNVKLPKIEGIALWPIILLRPKLPNKVLLNHEKIHIRQQAEMLVVFFYIWYILEWFFRFIFCFNFDKSYRSISFEKEAYQNEYNLEYLTRRKFWAFINYI